MALALGACAAEQGTDIPAPPETAEEHGQQTVAVLKRLDADPDNAALQDWAARLDEQAAVENGAFYSTVTDRGTIVRFYELADGGWGFSEIGRHDDFKAEDQKPVTDFVSLFKRIHPGQPVPAEIRQAENRIRAAAARPARQGDEGDGGNGEILGPVSSVDKHTTFSCAHFATTPLVHPKTCPQAVDGDGQWCACNLTGDMGWFGSTGNNETHSWHAIGVYDGNISTQFQFPNSGQFWSFLVQEGQLAYFNWISGSSGGNFSRWMHQSRITSATNDDFHWGACFDEERDMADNNNPLAGGSSWECPMSL